MFSIEVHKAVPAIVGKVADCGVRFYSMPSVSRISMKVAILGKQN